MVYYTRVNNFNQNINERKQDLCQWRKKRSKKRCNKIANVIYSVDTKHGVGICTECFDLFCKMQEDGKDAEAREILGLRPRKEKK